MLFFFIPLTTWDIHGGLENMTQIYRTITPFHMGNRKHLHLHKVPMFGPFSSSWLQNRQIYPPYFSKSQKFSEMHKLFWVFNACLSFNPNKKILKMIQSISNTFIWEKTHHLYSFYLFGLLNFLASGAKKFTTLLNHYLSSLHRLLIKETTFKKQLVKVKIPFNNHE